jgi:hypothetical protein
VVGTDPDQLSIGDRLRFAPTPVTDGISLPTFARVAS